MKKFTHSIFFSVCIFWSHQIFSQQTGEAIFNNNCKVCHTIGKGKLVGPDLANIHNKRSEEWLLKFIPSSQTMINSGDADAVAIFNEFGNIQMPDAPYSEEEIKSIIAYIASESPEETVSIDKADEKIEAQNAEEVVERPVVDATAADIELGQMLFNGKTRFVQGGPSCISCHHVKNDQLVGGGRLAKDLTGVFSRMNESGVKAIVSNPPFPVMRDAYSNGLVSDDEAYYLTAFLKYADKEQYGQHPRDYQSRFLITGIVGLILMLGLWSFIWRSRRKRAVNHKIFNRQLSSLPR